MLQATQFGFHAEYHPVMDNVMEAIKWISVLNECLLIWCGNEFVCLLGALLEALGCLKIILIEANNALMFV